MRKIFITAFAAAMTGIIVRRLYRCISRMVARSLIEVYSDALDNGAVISLSIRPPKYED